jgi:hypothetical protein
MRNLLARGAAEETGILAPITISSGTNMGWTTIDKCKTCGHKQENWYHGGYLARVVHCSSCGAETWLGYGETPGPCKKCGGREWSRPEGRSGFKRIWD